MKNIRKKIRFLFFNLLSCFLLMMLFSCSGGNFLTSGKISGVVMAGPITNAQVKAYAINSNFSKGSVLASAVTNSFGQYSIDVGNYSGSIILEASPIGSTSGSSSYIDEATGLEVGFKSSIHSVLASCELVGDTNAAITPVTEIAYQKMLTDASGKTFSMVSAYKIFINEKNEAVQKLFFGTSSLLSSLASRNVNIVTTLPVDIKNSTQVSSGSYAEVAYGTVLGMFSQYSSDITGESADKISFTVNSLASQIKSTGILEDLTKTQLVNSLNVIMNKNNQDFYQSYIDDAILSNGSSTSNSQVAFPQKFELLIGGATTAYKGQTVTITGQITGSASSVSWAWTQEGETKSKYPISLTGIATNQIMFTAPDISASSEDVILYFKCLVKNNTNQISTSRIVSVTIKKGSSTSDSSGSTSSTTSTTTPTTSNSAPYAENLSISGFLNIYQTLSASYTYKDADGDVEGNSIIQWQRATSSNGTFENISGATASVYSPVVADYQKYIRFSVRPLARVGSEDSKTYYSQPVGPIASAKDNSAPVAKDLKVQASISGTTTEVSSVVIENNSTLYASYVYSDADLDGEKTSKIQWQYYNSTTQLYSDISGATTKELKLSYEYGGKPVSKVRFYIIPYAEQGVSEGQVVYSKECQVTVTNKRPEAKALGMVPQIKSGQPLRLANEYWYTHYDADGDVQDMQNSRIIWYALTNGQGSPITSESEDTKTLYANDNWVGKHIYFAVEPKSLTGNTAYGDKVFSNGFANGTCLILAKTANPIAVVKNPQLSGDFKIQKTITLSYTFYDEDANYNTCYEDTSKRQIKWFRKHKTGSTWSQIANASAITYTPTRADYDYYIRASIKAVSRCSVDGVYDESAETYTPTDAYSTIGAEANPILQTTYPTQVPEGYKLTYQTALSAGRVISWETPNVTVTYTPSGATCSTNWLTWSEIAQNDGKLLKFESNGNVATSLVGCKFNVLLKGLNSYAQTDLTSNWLFEVIKGKPVFAQQSVSYYPKQNIITNIAKQSNATESGVVESYDLQNIGYKNTNYSTLTAFHNSGETWANFNASTGILDFVNPPYASIGDNSLTMEMVAKNSTTASEALKLNISIGTSAPTFVAVEDGKTNTITNNGLVFGTIFSMEDSYLHNKNSDDFILINTGGNIDANAIVLKGTCQGKSTPTAWTLNTSPTFLQIDPTIDSTKKVDKLRFKADNRTKVTQEEEGKQYCFLFQAASRSQYTGDTTGSKYSTFQLQSKIMPGKVDLVDNEALSFAYNAVVNKTIDSSAGGSPVDGYWSYSYNGVGLGVTSGTKYQFPSSAGVWSNFYFDHKGTLYGNAPANASKSATVTVRACNSRYQGGVANSNNCDQTSFFVAAPEAPDFSNCDLASASNGVLRFGFNSASTTSFDYSCCPQKNSITSFIAGYNGKYLPPDNPFPTWLSFNTQGTTTTSGQFSVSADVAKANPASVSFPLRAEGVQVGGESLSGKTEKAKFSKAFEVRVVLAPPSFQDAIMQIEPEASFVFTPTMNPIGYMWKNQNAFLQGAGFRSDLFNLDGVTGKVTSKGVLSRTLVEKKADPTIINIPMIADNRASNLTSGGLAGEAGGTTLKTFGLKMKEADPVISFYGSPSNTAASYAEYSISFQKNRDYFSWADDFTISSQPAWLKFSGTNQNIITYKGTPAQTDDDVASNISLKLENKHGTTHTTTFNLTVKPGTPRIDNISTNSEGYHIVVKQGTLIDTQASTITTITAKNGGSIKSGGWSITKKTWPSSDKFPTGCYKADVTDIFSISQNANQYNNALQLTGSFQCNISGGVTIPLEITVKAEGKDGTTTTSDIKVGIYPPGKSLPQFTQTGSAVSKYTNFYNSAGDNTLLMYQNNDTQEIKKYNITWDQDSYITSTATWLGYDTTKVNGKDVFRFVQKQNSYIPYNSVKCNGTSGATVNIKGTLTPSNEFGIQNVSFSIPVICDKFKTDMEKNYLTTTFANLTGRIQLAESLTSSAVSLNIADFNITSNAAKLDANNHYHYNIKTATVDKTLTCSSVPVASYLTTSNDDYELSQVSKVSDTTDSVKLNLKSKTLKTTSSSKKYCIKVDCGYKPATSDIFLSDEPYYYGFGVYNSAYEVELASKITHTPSSLNVLYIDGYDQNKTNNLNVFHVVPNGHVPNSYTIKYAKSNDLSVNCSSLTNYSTTLPNWLGATGAFSSNNVYVQAKLTNSALTNLGTTDITYAHCIEAEAIHSEFGSTKAYNKFYLGYRPPAFSFTTKNNLKTYYPYTNYTFAEGKINDSTLKPVEKITDAKYYIKNQGSSLSSTYQTGAITPNIVGDNIAFKLTGYIDSPDKKERELVGDFYFANNLHLKAKIDNVDKDASNTQELKGQTFSVQYEGFSLASPYTKETFEFKYPYPDKNNKNYEAVISFKSGNANVNVGQYEYSYAAIDAQSSCASASQYVDLPNWLAYEDDKSTTNLTGTIKVNEEISHDINNITGKKNCLKIVGVNKVNTAYLIRSDPKYHAFSIVRKEPQIAWTLSSNLSNSAVSMDETQGLKDGFKIASVARKAGTSNGGYIGKFDFSHKQVATVSECSNDNNWIATLPLMVPTDQNGDKFLKFIVDSSSATGDMKGDLLVNDAIPREATNTVVCLAAKATDTHTNIPSSSKGLESDIEKTHFILKYDSATVSVDASCFNSRKYILISEGENATRKYQLGNCITGPSARAGFQLVNASSGGDFASQTDGLSGVSFNKYTGTLTVSNAKFKITPASDAVTTPALISGTQETGLFKKWELTFKYNTGISAGNVFTALVRNPEVATNKTAYTPRFHDGLFKCGEIGGRLEVTTNFTPTESLASNYQADMLLLDNNNSNKISYTIKTNKIEQEDSHYKHTYVMMADSLVTQSGSTTSTDYIKFSVNLYNLANSKKTITYYPINDVKVVLGQGSAPNEYQVKTHTVKTEGTLAQTAILHDYEFKYSTYKTNDYQQGCYLYYYQYCRPSYTSITCGAASYDSDVLKLCFNDETNDNIPLQFIGYELHDPNLMYGYSNLWSICVTTE